MAASENNIVSVKTTINAPVEKVWELFTKPEHIVKWNQANDDWHSPKAENDLNVGGKFIYRMEAKNGSVGFDFGGTYTAIEVNKNIEYEIGDGRKVKVIFKAENDKTDVQEGFEPENTNPVDMQKAGWQAILDSFKKYVESNQ